MTRLLLGLALLALAAFLFRFARRLWFRETWQGLVITNTCTGESFTILDATATTLTVDRIPNRGLTAGAELRIQAHGKPEGRSEH